MEINPSKIKKILCIKPRGIGDIVLSTIILENLKEYFTDVKIDFLTEEFAVSAVDSNPLVNKVLSMKNKEFPLSVARRIRREKYDLVFDLWSNPRSAQITFLSGIKYRVGFAYRGRKYAYNILATSERGAHHSAEHNLEMLKVLGIPVNHKNIHYYPSGKDDIHAKEYIKDFNRNSNAVIGIVPSGGWPSKRCDATKWVEICKALEKKYKVVFLILWGPGDEDDANYIRTHLPEKTFLAPSTSVTEMASYINNCKIVLANDSGPMHISAAMGIPTLGIFGPTNPEMHGPYSDKSDYIIKKDLSCIICDKQICPLNHECFLELPAGNVLEKVEQLIMKNNLVIEEHEKI